MGSGYQNSVKTGSDKPNLFQNSDSTILVKVLQYYSLCFDYFKTKYCCYYLLFDDMILVVIISLLSLLQPTSNQPLDVGSKSALSKCKTTPDGPQVEVPCVFPFIYKGKEYNECTFQKGDVKAWCSTKVDGNGKHVGGQRQWGYCEKECPVQEEAQCRTTGGGRKNAPCIFPFKYKGKSYTKCVWQKDEPQPWCSTKVTKLGFHVGKQGQWGHCNEHCPMPTRPKEPDSEKEDANQKEGSMSTVDEIFIAEDNNPGDIRPGNNFDAGEYEYDYYDVENQPDLSNPERIAGATNANKVSGSSGVSEINIETKGCKRKCLQFKRVRKDGVLGNLVWKCVKKGCEAPSRDR